MIKYHDSWLLSTETDRTTVHKRHTTSEWYTGWWIVAASWSNSTYIYIVSFSWFIVYQPEIVGWCRLVVNHPWLPMNHRGSKVNHGWLYGEPWTIRWGRGDLWPAGLDWTQVWRGTSSPEALWTGAPRLAFGATYGATLKWSWWWLLVGWLHGEPGPGRHHGGSYLYIMVDYMERNQELPGATQ